MPSDRQPRSLIWFWGTSGAGVRYAARVAERIAEQHGPANVALALHEGNAWIERSRQRGHPVVTVGGAHGYRAALKIALQAPRRWLALQRLIAEFRPDVAVIPMSFALAWPYVLAFSLRNIPVVYVAHDDKPHAGDYMTLFQAKMQALLLRQATCVVAMSGYVAGQLRTSGWLRADQRCEVIPLTAHDVARRAEPRRRSPGPISFLFLGRLLGYKGLSLLADALEPLQDHTGWRLTIAGNGPEAETVRAAFSRFPQVELSHIRWLDEAEVDALIRSHDVLISPYLEASQSGVVSEALYDAMPCLVTPVGALPEQIGFGKAGWVAPEASTKALTRAITGLLEDPTSIESRSAGALDIARSGPTDAWGRLVRDLARERGPPSN